MNIRSATAADAAAILAIYAPIVRDTIISFETEVPSVAEIVRRIDTIWSPKWAHGRWLCLCERAPGAISLPMVGRRDGLRCFVGAPLGRRSRTLRTLAGDTGATAVSCGIRWHCFAQCGERRPARSDGVYSCRDLPRGRLQIRPLARRRVVAAFVEGLSQLIKCRRHAGGDGTARGIGR